MSTYSLPTLAAALVLLAGCASIPQPLQGTYAHASTASDDGVVANSGPVRWGGPIIHRTSDSRRTCFYLISRPLDYQARPAAGFANSDAKSVFVTCHAGQYDPKVFAKGRELTIVGKVDGTVRQQAGDREMTYPMVDADVVYLWPQRNGSPFPSDALSLMGNPHYPPEIDRQPTGTMPTIAR